MSILDLSINNFRNLDKTSFQPSPCFNFISGNNGAGKTSLLEAINYLTQARSFRCHSHRPVIQHSKDNFLIHGKVQQGKIKSEPLNSVGVSRSLLGKLIIRLNEKPVGSIADLIKIQPCQVMTPSDHGFFNLGPTYRRKTIHLGMFHVEPLFLPHWKNYQKLLKQRNSALKNKKTLAEVTAWDKDLIYNAEQLDQLYKCYLNRLNKSFNLKIKQFIPSLLDINIKYKQGWDNNLCFEHALKNSFSRSYQRGYTQVGPQRADFFLEIDNNPAQEILSQGQQKLVLYALLLSQGDLIRNMTKQAPLYLIDDLSSELDCNSQHALMQQLSELKAQVFITAINTKPLEEKLINQEKKVFHVEHGNLCQI